jgi:hypothetical protein
MKTTKSTDESTFIDEKNTTVDELLLNVESAQQKSFQALEEIK